MNRKYSIIIGGDVCPEADFDMCSISPSHFSDLFDVLKNSGFSIINLEAPIIDDTVQYSPIDKIGPSLSSNSDMMNLLKSNNLSAVTLSNNHIMDFGISGLKNTLNKLNSLDLKFVGAGLCLKERKKPLMCTIEEKVFTFINIAENEFSTLSDNEGANPIDLIDNYKDIVYYKTISDYVVIIAHSGHEGYSLPSPSMKKLFRFYLDSGADVVVAHHSHCFSGYEVYNNKHIFYGLGNLYFPWNKVKAEPWNYGFMLGINIVNDELIFSTIPYEQSTELCLGIKVYSENTPEYNEFNKQIHKLSSIIKDDDKLQYEYFKFLENKREYVLSSFYPYENRYMRFLARKKIIPSFLSRSKKTLLLNLMRCEAHRDACIEILKGSYNQ